jgi:hypothetical protein
LAYPGNNKNVNNLINFTIIILIRRGSWWNSMRIGKGIILKIIFKQKTLDIKYF